MGIHDRDYYQSDNLRPIRPWDNRSMVSLLIIANLAIYVANFLFTSRTGLLTQSLALSPSDLLQPWFWFHYISYGFAHDPGGISHILFNMLSLYFLGQGVESKYGKWEFFRFYMVTVVICGVVWTAIRFGQSPQSTASLIGASGGVTAVAMLFVFSFPQSTLYLYGALPVKAWVLGVIIILGNVFGSSAYVAYDVHLVGAAFAAVYFFAQWNFGNVTNILSGWYQGLRLGAKGRARGLKVHRPVDETASQPTKDDQEMDRILDKIHRDGQDSLTSAERKFMEQYSRQMRQRRSQSK
jgi:membrane associated rhomboid family serine protease